MSPDARLHHLVREEIVFDGPGARAAFQAVRAQVMGFTVYSPRTVSVNLPPGGIRPGLEFVQRLGVGPFGLLRLQGPVRVIEAWDRATPTGREAGFTYEALPGHVEVGHATFAVSLDGSHVVFRIESWSRPGRWFVRLAGPVARFVQKRAYAEAFRLMRAAATPNVESPSPG
ncbi:MAG: DUF1990 family protein [Thermoplasmatota archaeon]